MTALRLSSFFCGLFFSSWHRLFSHTSKRRCHDISSTLFWQFKTIAVEFSKGEAQELPFDDDAFDVLNVSSSGFPLPCNTKGSPYTCTAPTTFSAPPSGAQAGFFGNPDNTYIPALVDLRVPRRDKQQRDRVYVIRGKIPTTPPGESPVQWTNSAFQLRYWSICTGAYVRPYPTVEGDFACIADNAIVKTNADGQITPARGKGVRNPLAEDVNQ